MVVRTCCPHDCFDCCAIEAEVKNGLVVALKGASEHPVTRGFLCGKVAAYLKRQYSPERIMHPLRREGSFFKNIGWEEALDAVIEGLDKARKDKGPSATLVYTDAGSMGYLKSLEGRFWQAYGGGTFASGSLCSAAGLAALEADCGKVGQHDPSDIPNSKLILLWGRNPMITNIHMVPFIKEARARGAMVILINPMPSESASLADMVVKPRPGTDSALALGLAGEMIRLGLHDEAFMQSRTEGYDRYKQAALSWNSERTEMITGVPSEQIRELAMLYATIKPASSWLGFGLQRHAGGGNTVRAINTLGAISGNTGKAGGGVNYANRASRLLNNLGPDRPMEDERRVWKGTLAEELADLEPGAVRAAFVARSNPLLQCPDTNLMEDMFSKIGFKVVLEHFMTDTAKVADIILPAATFLEEDELYYSYFHNFISLGRKAVEPTGEAKSDLDIFKALAERMGYGCLSGRSALDWIAYAVEPMKAHGITMERLEAEGWVRFPTPEVPWQGGVFATDSGKLKAGVPDPPAFVPPHEMPDETHPFFLVTGASRDRLHSQYDNLGADPGQHPSVFMHPFAAARLGLAESQPVEVFTSKGSMGFILRFDSSMRQDMLYAHHGRWKGRGGGINRLIRGYMSDMGGQGAIYDSIAGIRPQEVL